MSTSLLADPLEHAPLDPRGPLLVNDTGVWPVLGGVPFLVPSPADWLTARRDAVLAALVEADRLERSDIHLLDTITERVRAAPVVVSDDFLNDEEVVVEVIEGPAGDLMRQVLATRTVLLDVLARHCSDGPVLEIGPGAGSLTRRISGRPLVVIDHSVRGLLKAVQGTDAIPVVAEAPALPVRPRTFRTVVAANVVDVVEQPDVLLQEISDALIPGGRLVCCTPDPGLGTSDPEALLDLLESAGWRVQEDQDGIPWLRVHGPREVQLFVVRLTVAEKPRSARRPSRAPRSA